MKIRPLLLSLLLSCSLQAEFEVSLQTTKDSTPDKSIVILTAKNSFSQSVKSARAWIFALDETGAVVGQKAAWIISKVHRERGDHSYLPSLDAGETAKIKMVIDTERPAASTKVTFTKIVLADGSLVNPHKQVIPYQE